MFNAGIYAGMGRRRASAAGPSPYAADAVYFDGTNDYLSKGALTVTNNNKLTISFWLNPAFTTGDPDHFILQTGTGNQNNKIAIRQAPTGGFQIVGAGATAYLDVSGFSTAENVWAHILFSCDLSDTGKRHLYIDGSSVTPTWGTYTDGTIFWDSVSNRIGRWASGTNGGRRYVGDLAEFYVTNEYIDLSVLVNREKFITGTGTGAAPVDLGTGGITPTGTSPIIFFEGNAASWNSGVNSGSGGNYSMVGAVTDSGNEPVEV